MASPMSSRFVNPPSHSKPTASGDDFELENIQSPANDPKNPFLDPERFPRNSTSSLSELSTSSDDARPSLISDFFSVYLSKIKQWKKDSKFYGWKWVVFTGIFMATLVLIANIIFTLTGVFANSGYEGGIVTLFTGDAPNISRQNTMLHVLINVLSTLLLSASNYAMQVLSAPTRTECVAAHRNGRWLDTGIPSFRNLMSISRKRRTLWVVLGLSSIPLHLFWNASIFEVVTGNNYDVELELNRTAVLTPFTNTDWAKIYNAEYVSGYSDVFLAVEYVEFGAKYSSNQSLLNLVRTFPNVEFLMNVSYTGSWHSCIATQNFVEAEHRHTGWHLLGCMEDRLEYTHFWMHGGFSHRVGHKSKIQMSLPFMLIVIVCNGLKLVALILTLRDSSEAPLATVGDAVSAFLTDPDPSSAGYCTYSKQEYLWKFSSEKSKEIMQQDYRGPELDRLCTGVWKPKRMYYISAISTNRRMFATFVCLLPVLTVIPFLVRAIPNAMPGRVWGTLSQDRFVLGRDRFDGPGASLLALVANAPQLLLSVTYLTLNSLFTSMAGAVEWNQLAAHRKGLRVIKPCGQQRESYFLQLPFRWVIPLNTLSGLLHWLASQTLFIVQLDRRDRTGSLMVDKSSGACGYSALSLLIFAIVLAVLDGIVIVLGLTP